MEKSCSVSITSAKDLSELVTLCNPESELLSLLETVRMRMASGNTKKFDGQDEGCSAPDCFVMSERFGGAGNI